MLFKTYHRDYGGHRTRKFSAYNFLNESSWSIADVMRERYNIWGQDFANDSEFVSRFQSKCDQQHYSACFELLTCITFKKLGFSVEKHPFTGTSKRLDFRIQSKTNFEGYLECTLSGNSSESLEERNRKDTVIEIVEEMDYYPYFINLDFRKISKKSIPKNKFLSFVNKIEKAIADVPDKLLWSC